MENSVIAVIFLGFSTIILIFFKPLKIKNHPSSGKRIVAFGDSLIKGIGATEECDFVTLLSEEIGEPIVNLGVPKNTSAQGLERIDGVIRQHPKVVLVLFGGNDYLQSVPIEETFKNIDTIVQKLQDVGAVVVLLGIQGGIVTDPYASHFKSIAKKRETLYVPSILDGLIGVEDLMSDDVHPNDKGYRIVADKIYPILEKAL